MAHIVENYIVSRDEALKYFGCGDNFYISPETKCNWSIRNIDEIFLLTLYNKTGKEEFAIVKKEGKPMIFKKESYTMVVAINCIKIAFIVKNSLEKIEENV